MEPDDDEAVPLNADVLEPEVHGSCVEEFDRDCVVSLNEADSDRELFAVFDDDDSELLNEGGPAARGFDGTLP